MIGKHVVIDTLDNFKAKLDLIPSSAIVLIKDVGQIYAHGTYFGAQKTYSLLTKTADGLAPKGGTSASSLISDVNTEWVLTVTNGENPTWRKLPANAFNSASYTLTSATTSDLGGIKVGQVYTATFDDLVGLYYKVNIDKNGLAYVHVPWINNPYTASGSGITLKDNVFSLSLNSVTKLDSAIGNKIYAVSLDKNGKLCVSVPWTDTNNIFVGATETKNGSSGMVPAPIANQHRYFLRGDGTWVKPNLSDLNDDVVNGKYLPLTGGTISGSLVIQASSPGVTFKKSNALNPFASLGIYSNKLSMYVSSENKYYDILHSGNYKSYALPITGGSIKSSDIGLHIKRTNGHPKIAFYIDETLKGYIGYNADGKPVIHNASGDEQTIFHSGNFKPSDYLPLSGGTLSDMLFISRNASFGLYINNTAVSNPTGYSGMMFQYGGNNTVGLLGDNKGDLMIIASDFSNKRIILHEGNYSNYALPLSGGTVDGMVTIKRAASIPLYVYSTDNNVSEVGIRFTFNSGYVASIAGKKGSETLWRMDSTLSNKYQIWDSGNDGSGSGLDADLLDGRHSSGFAIYEGIVGVNVSSVAASIGYTYATQEHGGLYAGGFINFGTNGYFCQLHGNVSQSALAYRFYNTEYGKFSDWKSIAFTDSNVASATKLQTARTIWGQSFDGTGNVSGVLTLPLYNQLQWADSGGAMIYGTSSKRIIIDGNVGIGTTSPNQKLHVEGGVQVNGQIIGANSIVSNTTNGYFVGNRNDGLGVTDGGLLLYTYGKTPISFYANGERMRINSSGNVGIGTTNPSSKLHVEGSMNLTGEYKIGGYDVLRCYKSALEVGRETSVYQSYSTNIWGYGINFYNKGGTRLLAVTNDGNFGFGVANPISKLHVNGVLTLPLNNQVQWTDSGGAMIYGTSGKRIIIDGNVGIGIASPSVKLEVDGSIKAHTNISATDAYFSGNCFLKAGQEGIYVHGSGISWHNSSNAWTKSIVNITSEGKVGIGVSPEKDFHVGGDFKASGQSYFGTSTGCDLHLLRTNGYNYITAYKSLMLCVDGGSNNYALSLDSSTKNATFYGNVTAPSFIKSGSSDDYVLLGGGGHTKIHGLVEYGLENLASSFSSGGQTSVASNIVTFTGGNSDTYFSIHLTQTIDYTIPYTVGVYVENWSGTGSWSFGVGALNNGSFVLTITKNGWNWGTGYFTSASNGASSFILDDTYRPTPAPAMKISKAVVVKGTSRAHYTPPLSKLSYYLPIGGGTLTGDLKLDTYIKFNNTNLSNWNVTRSDGALRIMHIGNSSTGNAPTAYCSGLSVMSKYTGFLLASYGGESNAFYFRSVSDGDKWLSWREVAFKDYVSSNYLPLIGGTLANTGTVLTIKLKDSTKIPYINFRLHNDTDLGDLGVNSSKNLVYYNSGGWKKIWHEGNLTPGNYLPASSYTAADVLTKIKSVDGSGSGLDADTVDGYHANSFVYSTGTYNLKPNAGCYRPRTTYIAIRLSNVNSVWTMMCMELLIREHYSNPNYGKVILLVDKNNANTLSGGLYYVLGKLSSSFKIYAAWDGTYFTVYLAGSWAYDSMTVQEVLFGDTAAETDNKSISVTGVNTLPSGCVTLTMKNYYTVVGSAGTDPNTIYYVT